MKNNATNMRIDEMHFDRLTLVFGEYAGKAHVPVNPAATIVAVKGGPVETNPIRAALTGAFERLGFARKSDTVPAVAAAPVTAPAVAAAAKSTADEAIENAGVSALFNLLYNLECDVYSIMSAGLDDAAKKAAILALVMSFYEAAIALSETVFGEKSMAIEAAAKAGVNPDAETARAQIALLEKTVVAATKARQLLGAAIGEPPAAIAPVQAPQVAAVATSEPAAKSTTEATNSVKDALKSAEFATMLQAAVKSAIAPMQEQVTGANQRAAEAEARAIAADAAKSAAVAAQGEAEQRATKAEQTAIDTARQRSAPAGHQDATEAAQTSADATKASADTAPAPTTLLGAIKTLHAAAPAA